jgi:hypothetical protein
VPLAVVLDEAGRLILFFCIVWFQSRDRAELTWLRSRAVICRTRDYPAKKRLDS